ncbi:MULTISPECIES: hypothetical protein [unclassified Spirosoma]|uniref:hypothetical protein n=1 Tax=unclassified Spirosoma TaxID=2621999 RepID=UPI000966B882|nr:MULTISPECIES: hypothetical protein [unclassified Spirosoma]MBN8820923.1 hypothetical protein [Spirosoma sp.]OJW75935.1 MAG: hypothetical protein BGO59_03635 [Spirosoma sp. 48-14]
MTFDQFTATLTQPQPPTDLHPVLQGLWYDANDDWEQAHSIAQSREGTQAYDRLHAYLHRKEGDRFNANYWYRRAGASFFTGTLDEEWAVLVRQYL